MLPTFVEETCAFEFWQKLELVYREATGSAPVTSRALQQGFLLVESRKESGRLVRVMAQHLLSAASLARLRPQKMVALKEYSAEHLKLYFSIPKPFGLELPVEFSTDVLGGGAALTGVPPKAKPSMPYEMAHFPLVTPALSAEAWGPEVGTGWKSAVSVRCGFGTFVLPYSVVWTGKDLVQATAQVTFDPPTGQEKPEVLRGVNLLFRPAGAWTVSYNLMDGSPALAKGSLQYVVTATVPPRPAVTEVINLKLDFKWRKVPVGFTHEHLMTASWGMMPVEFGG